jgi:uracil-DNA glycosylase family protein
VARPAALDELRRSARSCTACHLYERATQTVFGEGSAGAHLMLVGEQPGDKEDKAGQPFVGPAGKVLDDALKDAGIDRGDVYVTNAVKHFKWTPRGKMRLHQKPNAEEIAACRPWLDAEIEAVRPRLVVCLGATAAQALLGRTFRVTKQRGQPLEWPARLLPSTAGDEPVHPQVMATVHPSSILRAPDPEAREAEYAAFVADLKVAARVLAAAG